MLKNSQIGEGWERRKQNKLGLTGSFAILRRIKVFCRITAGKFDGRIRRDVEPDAASVAP
jgi:hypothetical protein